MTHCRLGLMVMDPRRSSCHLKLWETSTGYSISLSQGMTKLSYSHESEIHEELVWKSQERSRYAPNIVPTIAMNTSIVLADSELQSFEVRVIYYPSLSPRFIHPTQHSEGFLGTDSLTIFCFTELSCRYFFRNQIGLIPHTPALCRF